MAATGLLPAHGLVTAVTASTLLAGLAIAQSPLTPAMPMGRTFAGADLDATTGRVLMFGGRFDNHLWEFDGAYWHLRAFTGSGPAGTSLGCVAYDSARARLVCYDYSLNTWEWDGASWSLRQTASAPGVAYGMVFDGTRCLLLAEQLGQYVLWGWDGTNWTLVAPAGPARTLASAMAFDPIRSEVVLFGGSTFDPYTGHQQPSAAMSRWNGVAWGTVPFAANWPAARSEAAFAFDPSRGVLVLHGGIGGFLLSTDVADVAEWNGSSWSPAQPAPPARGHSLVWHPGSAAMLTIGGETGQVHAWNGTQWRTPASQGSPYFFRSVVDAGSRLLAVNTFTAVSERQRVERERVARPRPEHLRVRRRRLDLRQRARPAGDGRQHWRHVRVVVRDRLAPAHAAADAAWPHRRGDHLRPEPSARGAVRW